VLKKNADATWDCKFFFTSTGDEVTTKTVSCSVGEKKIAGVYEAEADGTPLRIDLDGTFTGSHGMEGTYKAVNPTSGETVDQGTWKASANQ
jgi:hypothetical protein